MMVTCTFPHRRRRPAGHGILSASMGPGPDQHIMMRVPPQPPGDCGRRAGWPRGRYCIVTAGLPSDDQPGAEIVRRAGPAVLADTRMRRQQQPSHSGLSWQGMWLLGTGLTVVADGEPEQKR